MSNPHPFRKDRLFADKHEAFTFRRLIRINAARSKMTLRKNTSVEQLMQRYLLATVLVLLVGVGLTAPSVAVEDQFFESKSLDTIKVSLGQAIEVMFCKTDCATIAKFAKPNGIVYRFQLLNWGIVQR